MRRTVPLFGLVMLCAPLLLAACDKKEKAETEKSPLAPASAGTEPILVDTENITSLKRGDTLQIRMADSSQEFNLIIRRVQETIPGITSISANIGDKDQGQANLIFRDGRIAGSLQMFKEGYRYQVGYDSVLASHYLKKIMPEDENRIESSAPLIPGKDNRQ